MPHHVPQPGSQRIQRHSTIRFRLGFDLVVYFLVALSSAVGCILVFVPDIPRYFNDIEAWKITTNFVFVTLFSGLVALLYRRSELERERRRAQRASLEEFYRDFVDAYHECKKIRRTVAAYSARNTHVWQIERVRYEKLMDELEDVQLKMERMFREVELREYLFSDRQTSLQKELKEIESYLNRLLDGYEKSYNDRRAVEEAALIDLDESLRVFVESKKRDEDSEGSKALFRPAERVRKLLVDLIEGLRLKS
jgi:hypothetical protein